MFRKVFFFVISFCCLFCDAKNVKIAWLIPSSNSGYPINIGNSRGAMAVAMSAVTGNTNILSGYKIDLKPFETRCDSQSGMMSAMKAQNSYDPDVFIGPPCLEAMKSVAKYGEFWNIPVFSWYNPDREFDSYTNLIRMHPPMKTLAKSLVYALKEFGQTQISLLYEEVLPYSTLKESVEAELQVSGIRLLYTGKYNKNWSDLELNDIMLTMKKYSTVNVFLMSSDDVRRCMLSSVRTGMTAGQFRYIHLDPQIYKDTELNMSILSDGYWRRGDKSDQAAQRAYDQLTHIIVDPMFDDQSPTLSNPRSRYTDFNRLSKSIKVSNYSSLNIPSNGKIDVYSLYLYDAISVWSVLVDQMLKENISQRDGKVMAARSKTFEAEGSTGFISLDNNADRLAKVFLLRMGTDGAFHPQKILKFNKTGGYKVTASNKVIKKSEDIGGSSGGEHSPPSQSGSKNEPVQTQSSSKPSSKSSVLHTTHGNDMGGIQQTVDTAGQSDNSLTAIIARLVRLEKTLTQVLNHDHSRDHPPHQRLHHHAHSNTHSHPIVQTAAPVTTTPKPEKLEASAIVSNRLNGNKSGASKAKPKTSSANTVDVLASQLLNKLTGVIDQKFSAIHSKQAVKHKPTTKQTTTMKPTPTTVSMNTRHRNGEHQGGGQNGEQQGASHSGEQQANHEYSEMMSRLKEEIPPEMRPFFDFVSFTDPPPIPTNPPRRMRNRNFQQRPRNRGNRGGRERGSTMNSWTPTVAPPRFGHNWYNDVLWL